LRLPAGFDYPKLHAKLREDEFVIYEGQGRLAKEAFRVANMGALSEADFDRFLASLGKVLGRS
jgi:2-aminoethylphosphonate-pyruvate transaminase